ncbi:PTS sugar transporter subunit IIA [Anaerofustis stercorihominis]|nr:PTS sugar transporter subunit IIA [Anaerofustis stercorihominis]MCQ4795029.1 PTS sugar transporter subunit IIA [Anaerofustis stercorihominis]
MNLFYCSPRQRKMLKLLISSEGYITGPELSNKLGVSDRTIRNDVGILNYVLEQYNCQVISKRGKGYILKSENKELLNSILSQYSGYKNQKKERVYDIIIMLLCEKNNVDLYEIEDSLFISRTTLENEIQNIKEMLKSFYPSIDLRREKGKIELIGNETTLRFLLNEILMLKYDSKKQKLFIQNKYFKKESFEVIRDNVSKIALKYHLDIDDSAVADIAVYLLIAKVRLKLNKRIIKLKDEVNKDNDILYKIGEELYKEILEDKSENDYKQNEINQIAVKLSFVNLFTPLNLTREEAKRQMPSQIIEIVESLISNIKDDYDLDLSMDDELFMGLIFHVRALINRVKYQQLVESPILDMIKKQYTFIFELSLHIYEIFKKVLGIKLTESELSYIAAHIAAAIERMRLHYGKAGVKIAIISHMAPSYTKLLVSNLKNIFSQNIEIIGSYPVYKIDEALEENPSIILSTCKIENLNIPANIKHMEISLVLSNEEQQILASLIEDVRSEFVYKKSSKAENIDESIINKFNKDLFFPNLNVNTKEEALSLISNVMLLKGYVNNDFLDKVLEREKLSNTVLDNMIAIPHPVEACANKTIIGVISLPKAITWGDYKVKLIFVLAVRKDEKAYMRNVFKFISRLMDDKNKVDKLVNSKTFKEFIESVKKLS